MGNIEVKEAFRGFKQNSGAVRESGMTAEVLFNESAIPGLLKYCQRNMEVQADAIKHDRIFIASNMYDDRPTQEQSQDEVIR
jgi:hypothetical protein